MIHRFNVLMCNPFSLAICVRRHGGSSFADGYFESDNKTRGNKRSCEEGEEQEGDKVIKMIPKEPSQPFIPSLVAKRTE